MSITLKPKPCPCGCKKLIMEPLFHCQCSSLNKAEAEELARIVNAHDDLVTALKMARECVAWCRKHHKDAQSGSGIPVEVIIDAALAKAGA